MPIRERNDPYASAATELPSDEGQPLVPQTPVTAPLPVLTPSAFVPQPEKFAVNDAPIPAPAIDPEAASVIFAPGDNAEDPDVEELRGLREWHPALVALGAQPGAPAFFQRLAAVAEALLEVDGELGIPEEDEL